MYYKNLHLIPNLYDFLSSLNQSDTQERNKSTEEDILKHIWNIQDKNIKISSFVFLSYFLFFGELLL